MKCERCGKEVSIFSMSFFSTQNICLDCIKKEENHPNFREAKKIENEHVKAGNYNFEGIGLPNDL